MTDRRATGRGPVLVVVCWIVATGLLALTGCGTDSEAQTASGGASAPAAKKQQAEPEQPAEDAIAVELGAVNRRTMSEVYSTSATLRAAKRATITARTQGVVHELRVEEGDWVTNGQVVVVLEDDEPRIALEQARAASETLRREFERASALHAQGLMSDEEFDATRRVSVEAGHSESLAELTLSRTVIRAPFAGRILTRHLDLGATVSDGTNVYDIADLQPLYADVQVPERQVSRLSAGQTVRIAADADGQEAAASIERIAPVVDTETGTVKVTIAVQQSPGLRPGSFVRVGIVTATRADTLVVPRSALVAEGRRWHLFRVKDDDRSSVELVEVTRGFEEGDRVEILETVGRTRPLAPDDPVVVSGASSLSDGSAVRVMNAELQNDTPTRGSADEVGGVAS